jgi:hypothetical protein
MFEIFPPVDRPVARGWPLFMYSTVGLVGLANVVVNVSRHGFSHPTRLILSGVMFFLSLIWLVATLKARTPITIRSIGYRPIVLLVLLEALNLLSSFR